MTNTRISYSDYMDECSKSLATYGWTFPVQLSPKEINDLVRISHDKLDIDRFFIKHYSHKPNLFWMFKSVYSSELYDRWYKLIEQCIKAYRSELYTITVPALITVIEGAIANLSATSKTGIIDLCKERAENIDISLDTRELWNSFYFFALKLFENQPFNKERPQIINRHWILHGRDSDEWDQADCIRLFQALHTLVSAERSKPKRTFLWKDFDEGSSIP